jgi:hypothetical protein
MLAIALLPALDWVKSIYDSGPAAILVFVASVTLVYSAYQLKKNPNRRLHEIIYLSNWVLVGLLAITASIAFFFLHKQPAIIRGAIDNLPEPYQVKDFNSGDFSFYVRKEYSERSRNRYHWLATTEHKSKDTTTLSIEVYAPLTKEQTAGYDSELRFGVDDTFYEQPVGIVYSHDDDSYTLRIQGRPDAPIPVKHIGMTQEPSLKRGSTNSIVYAASTLDAVTTKNRLESIDPKVRRDARGDLAKSGLEALPFIETSLVDPHSSPALLLGVLVGLDLMDIPSEGHLSGIALAQIIRSSSSPNAEIANAANTYITKRGALSVHRALTAWLTANQSEGKRSNDVALEGMDLLYKFGNRAREEYRRKHDSASFAPASNAFEQAWSDRRFAEHADQIYFARALYGMSLLLADRATIERDKNGGKKPQYVLAAKDKFLEFLRASQAGHSSTAYPEPSQIEQAKAYVKDPNIQF